MIDFAAISIDAGKNVLGQLEHVNLCPWVYLSPLIKTLRAACSWQQVVHCDCRVVAMSNFNPSFVWSHNSSGRGLRMLLIPVPE